MATHYSVHPWPMTSGVISIMSVCVWFIMLLHLHIIYLPNARLHLEPQDYIILGKEISR